MSNIQKLGTVTYMDDGKDKVATCELNIRDTNNDGLISNPHSRLEITLGKAFPSSQVSPDSDIVECDPSTKGANIFSDTAADLALKRMGIHLFASPSILSRSSSDYTKQIATSALTLYVQHMSEAESLSRSNLTDKSLDEIKTNLKKIELHLEQAGRFERAVNANFGERSKFEDEVKNRAYTNAAREIGKRAIVAANEAVASQNPKSPKTDEAIQLFREYEKQARNANLGLNEISRTEDTVLKLLAILNVPGPI